MSERAGGTRAAVRALRESEDFTKLLAMMALSFTVIFVVGVLRPIRDAIALDGLEPGDFYQVYFVSAIVVLFVPFYNRLADHLSWRRLIPAVAVFFAASMVLFRFLYLPGSAAFGLVFYGWYDLMVAALVTQFFMATQLFYNARDAKRAYPIVIAAGSVGAAIGGGITAFFASRLGTPNLLLVAAAAIVAFAAGIAMVWARENPDLGRSTRGLTDEELSASEFKRIFSHPQVRLIAMTVLLTVLVKQFVDYEYKTLSREVYTDLDALSGFLGLVDAATQWSPILVLLALRPILRRFGAGVGVLIFPVAMILVTGAMAVSMTLAVAVVARTGERMFRYSAERTGREILYVPVPDEIKLKAKAYIDVAMEKGVGKVLSGVLLAIPALVLASMSVRGRLVVVAFVGLALAALLLVAFLRVRREYVATLAESFEGRFASLQGTYVSLEEAGALDLARAALGRPEPLRVHFALDLLRGAHGREVARLAPELHDLLGHARAELRAEALEMLARAPEAVEVERVRPLLEDPDPTVRRRAVAALAAAAQEGSASLMERLLASDDPRLRTATLDCLGEDVPAAEAEPIARAHFERLRADGRGGRWEEALELAAAAGLAPSHPEVVPVLRDLMSHEDDEVAATAIRSAGRLGDEALTPDLIRALGPARSRGAARSALAERGEEVLGPLINALNDPGADLWIRRGVASVLGDIRSPATVDALITSYLLPETEQALDDRTLAALQRLRSLDGDLDFPPDRIRKAIDREVEATERYAGAAEAVSGLEPSRPRDLLLRALREAQTDRRTSVFQWLGLRHSQHGMHRSRLALASDDDRQRANALEWLESTVGHAAFLRLAPVLGGARSGGEPARAGEVLRDLWEDEDVWIARCALWTSFEAEGKDVRRRLTGFAPTDPGLERVVARIERLTDGGPGGGLHLGGKDEDMDLIERVFLLQGVDLLSGVRSRQLALLASIARELEAGEDRVLIEKGEPTDALYVVIRGEVALEGMGDQRVTVSDGQGFGTWALIDEQPSLVEARAVRPTRLLRISRVDFRDLLVDHPELGLDLLQGLARRVRTLATA